MAMFRSSTDELFSEREREREIRGWRVVIIMEHYGHHRRNLIEWSADRSVKGKRNLRPGRRVPSRLGRRRCRRCRVVRDGSDPTRRSDSRPSVGFAVFTLSPLSLLFLFARHRRATPHSSPTPTMGIPQCAMVREKRPH